MHNIHPLSTNHTSSSHAIVFLPLPTSIPPIAYLPHHAVQGCACHLLRLHLLLTNAVSLDAYLCCIAYLCCRHSHTAHVYKYALVIETSQTLTRSYHLPISGAIVRSLPNGSLKSTIKFHLGSTYRIPILS